jgi:hypothetical protein
VSDTTTIAFAERKRWPEVLKRVARSARDAEVVGALRIRFVSLPHLFVERRIRVEN